MRSRLPILGVAILVSFATGLSAQVRPPLAVGTRVRVTSLSSLLLREKGTVAGTAGDTLLFRSAHCGTECPIVRLAPDALDRLEVFAGRSVAHGAMVGAPLGGLAGAMIGAAVFQPRGCGGDSSSLETAGKCLGASMGALVVGMSVGVLVGALVGADVGAGGTWQDVLVGSPQVRLGLAAAPRGIGLTLRASF